VGAAAQTADVLGAIDIAAALQAAAVSQTAVEVSTSVAPTVDEGLKIEKSGDQFNYGEDIYEVQSTTLDENDLDMLEDVTYEDNQGTNTGDDEYKQELWFGNAGVGSAGTNVFGLQFLQPGDNDNYPDGRPAGSYLNVDKNKWVYNYTMEFKTAGAVTVSNAADIEGTTFEIQGNTYTVTDASVSAGMPTKLKLVAGDSTMWLVQDQPYTIGSHTVTVVDVDSGETKCGVNVDGVTIWIDDGTTEEFGDMSVGVLDVVAVYTKDYDADTCELSLGSNEITLEEGQEIEMNGVELDGSDVDFFGTGSAWTGMRIKYKPGSDDGLNQDEMFLAPGEAWTDPVFGNFKVAFEGVTGDFEDVSMKVSGDDATLTFENNDGREVELYWHYSATDAGPLGSTSEVFMGTDTDELILKPGDEVVADAEGMMLLYTTSGGEVHLLEITDLDCSSTSANKTTIKDLTYDSNLVKDETLVGTCGVGQEPITISLGSLGSIELELDTNFVNYTTTYGVGDYETSLEGNFSFANDTITFTEKAPDETAVSSGDKLTWTLVYDSTDDNIDIVAPSNSGTWHASAVDNDESDDDTKWYVSAKGTTIAYDAEDDLSLELSHPEDAVYANVFVMPMSASITSGGSDSVMADKVNPFSVGLAVLDSEAGSMSKNMIVVGGPCANTVAAELMGNPENCAEGFEAGKAMLKYFDRSGMAALLVAGDQADDTVGAAYVLADYDSYDLSGDEVEVVVTSLDEITVS
jgi:hypothetical protein